MTVKNRFTKIARVFFNIFLDLRKEFIIIKKHGFKYAQKKMEKTHKKRAQELYNLAINLGGVLIKLCQYFSTRRDIFPEAYVEILQSLQDQVPPVSFEEIEAVLTKEYNDYNKIFKCINKEAQASASLGQTHRAELITGEEVVIKILKPKIQEIIDTDFSIIYHVFHLFSNFKIFKEHADFFSLLDEFIRITGDELNFSREIYISKVLKQKLSHLTYLKIPYVYEKFSNKNVIVMEYCEGDKITDIEKWKSRNNDPIILSKRIIEIYMEQFINIKIIHFDPHPGNILISENNNLALLDFGMSGEITDKMSNGIKNGLKGFINKDYLKIINVLDELGFIKKGANKYRLLPIMEYFFDEIISSITLDKESIQSVDLSPVLDDLVELIYTQPITLPVEWAYIGKTISTLTGIIAALNPNIKIYDEFEPYAQKLLTNSIPEIIDQTKDSIKDFGVNLFQLPNRINEAILKINKGELKFKVDFEEVDNKIDELKNLAVKLVTLGVSIVFFIGFYVLFFIGIKTTSFVLAGLGTILLLFTFLRKNKTKKNALKDRIFK